MKTINDRGMTFEVEDHFKYIATDADGEVFAFEHAPWLDGDCEQWFVEKGRVKLLHTPCHDWRESLENI